MGGVGSEIFLLGRVIFFKSINDYDFNPHNKILIVVSIS